MHRSDLFFSNLQMMVVAIFEIIVYALNENIGAGRFSAVDMGKWLLDIIVTYSITKRKQT